MSLLLDKMTRRLAAIDWLGVARILVVQVAVLLVLSLAVIRYVTWTSDIALAEFSRTIDKAETGAPLQHDPASRRSLAVTQKRAPWPTALLLQ